MTRAISANDPPAIDQAAHRLPLIAISVTGFASSLGQILILRELLVLFYGNELSTGLVFTSWLLWTAVGSGIAGRWSHRITPSGNTLSLLLVLLAILLPATLCWIRATRVLWNIPLGELLSPCKMLLIAFSSTGAFCLLSGFIFAYAWALRARSYNQRQARPITIYLGEAVGAAVGGLSLYFVFLPHLPVLVATLSASLIVLLAAGTILWHRYSPHRRRSGVAAIATGLWFVSCLLVAGAYLFHPQLDRITRFWQWGPQLLTARDTPHGNLALIKTEDQFTVFASGLWLTSAPDPQTSEYAVHLALLQQPHPQTVLVIGGGIAGVINEILKYIDVKRVDFIEPDPEIIKLAEEYLPSSATVALSDHRVRIFHEDAGSFVRGAEQAYDVVLLNIGDPLNLQLNRFYTVEFYRQIKKLLRPGGIFSFAGAVSGDMVGPVQARFLRSVYATLRSVFPQVVVYPGDQARFAATDGSGRLLTDPRDFTDRLTAQGFFLQYIREDTLMDLMNPLRFEYLASILRKDAATQVNRDFMPVCYFNDLLIWSAQLHPVITKLLLKLAELSRFWFWAGLAMLAAGIPVFFRCGRPRPGPAVMVNVAIVGGVLMVLEIVLLLVFQILEGFLYRELALIIASFMAGLALGAAIEAWLLDAIASPRRLLILVQALLCLYLLEMIGLLLLLQSQQPSILRILPATVVFAILALIGGVLGGLHFALAVRVVAGTAAPSAKTGGGLYGLDLLGAAAGALAAALFVIPVYGLITTLSALVLLGAGSLLALLPRPIA
jgi:spermidine synthase